MGLLNNWHRVSRIRRTVTMVHRRTPSEGFSEPVNVVVILFTYNYRDFSSSLNLDKKYPKVFSVLNYNNADCFLGPQQFVFQGKS
jgi:hypothetical protein